VRLKLKSVLHISMSDQKATRSLQNEKCVQIPQCNRLLTSPNMSSNREAADNPAGHRVTNIKPGAYLIVNKDTNLGLDIQSDDPKVEPQVVCNARKRIRSQK
jgi:hypothetical protein